MSKGDVFCRILKDSDPNFSLTLETFLNFIMSIMQKKKILTL